MDKLIDRSIDRPIEYVIKNLINGVVNSIKSRSGRVFSRASCRCSTISCALVVCLLGSTNLLHAADQPGENMDKDANTSSPNRNLVDLSASATRLVANEEIKVTLASERRGKNPADLAQQANEDVAWAAELVKQKPAVKLSSGNYQTFPLYSQGNQSKPTWQLVQEIVISSTSVEDVTALLGELQNRLQIRNTQFFITPQTRREVENQLIEEAMKAFRERAEVIGRMMPAADYEIVHISVRTDSGGNPEMRMMRNVAAVQMDMEDSMPAPTVEAGQTSITVHVNGSVVYP